MKTILLSLALVFFLFTCGRAQKSVANDGFAVRTTVAQGELEGIYSTASGIEHYLGVPFAAPPIGDLRWRAPQPPAAWQGIREAKEFGNRAVQKYVYTDMRFRSEMSEDCLYLNVWAPTDETKEGLPILLYFHGGGNRAGSGDELRYDGEELAKQGIIVITANYRLGVFGFLAHPELSAETDHASGNYGLLDQVAALNWVRENARAFGGNPDQITIGGESAGSIDCSVLMASPLSRDKIAGVFAQSGAAMYDGMRPVLPAQAETTGRQFLEAHGYKSIAQLRQATTKEVYEAAHSDQGFNDQIVVDGHLLEEIPLTTYTAGRQAKVPLMIGWTSTETAWLPAPKSAADYEASIRKNYGAHGEDILRLYPASDYVRSSMALSSDNWIVLGTWKWADLHTRTGNAPVYRWQFDQVRPPLVGQVRETEPPGAGHATDIEYFFNTLNKSDAYAWTQADHTAAMNMSQHLAHFVRTGNPHGDSLVPWPEATSGAPHPVMHLKEQPEVINATQDDRYRLLEDIKTNE